MKAAIYISLALLALCEAGLAQGFINLNFESANVYGYSQLAEVQITNALPGWSASETGSFGAGQINDVIYDGVSTGSPQISLVDSNITINGSPAPFYYPIQGKYSIILQAAETEAITISQSAMVPAGTESFQFDAQSYGYPFIVTFDGQTIDMLPLEVYATYTLYGGNMPLSLAGQMATLGITEPPPTALGSTSGIMLDNLGFSPVSVPEPRTTGLAALGSLLFAWRCWRKPLKT